MSRHFRYRYYCLTAISCALIISGGRALGQNSIWQAMYDGGIQAQARGNLADAVKQYSAALKNADDDATIVLTAGKLASVLDQSGKFPEARENYEHVLTLDKKLHGQKSAQVGNDFNNLGLVWQHEGNFTEAESYFKKSVEVFESSDKKIELAGVLTNLALLMQETARYDGVEPLFKRCLSLYEKGGHASSLAEVLDRYGAFCQLQGRYSEAEALFTRALAIRQEASPTSPAVTDTLCELGQLHNAQADYTKAQIELEKALSLAKLNVGDKGQEADVETALADCLKDQGKYADAGLLYQNALDLLQTATGTSNTRVAQAMRNLAQNFVERRDYGRAESLLIKALKTDEQAYGALHPDLAVDLQTLALVCLDQGKYDKSEILYKKALKLTETVFGPEHPSTATSLNNLAWLYYNMGKYTEAEPLVMRALAIRQKQFGEKHPLYAQNLSIYASILSVEGKFDQAEAFLLKAIAAEEESLGVDHPAISENLKNLAVLYISTGRNVEAEDTLHKLLGRDEKAYGKDSAAVASDLESLSTVLLKQHKIDESAPLVARAQKIKSGLPGALPPSSNGILPNGQPVSSLSGEKLDLEISVKSSRPVKDKWALVVGVSNFKDRQINLKYAAKDATDFCHYLISEAHFKPDHVRLLVDSQATRGNIVDSLGDKWLRKLAASDDLVCIFMSTHGSAAKPEVGSTNFVVPYEGNMENIVFTGIPMQWLTAGLKDLVHCQRIVVLLDVCHGGAATAGSVEDSKVLAGIENALPSPENALPSARPAGMISAEVADIPADAKGLSRQGAVDSSKMSMGDGQVLMASSSASQISWESKNYQNGVFTRRLIEGLRQNGDKTTLDQAFSYMKARVEEEVLRDRAQVQTPIMEKKWQGEAPTFAVVPTEPRPGLSDAAGGSINANGNPNANSRANTLPLKGRAGTKTK